MTPAHPPPARKRRRRGGVATVAVLASCAALLAACIGSNPTGQEIRSNAKRASADSVLAAPTARASNAFAIDLYRATAAGSGNFVSSPYAAMLALAMIRGGAGGDTRAQLDALLHAELTPDLDGGLNALSLQLASRNGEKASERQKGRVNLEVAAALWGQRGTRYVEPWLDLLAVDYGSGIRVVDFRSDAEDARLAINRWGSDLTRGNIDQLVPRGGVTQHTRFLASTFSFLQAPWQVPFDASKTKPAPFHLADGTTVDVATMQVVSRTGIRFARGDGWQAAELGYLGDELTLVVVVPDDLASFEAALSEDWLRDLIATLSPRALDLRLPQFQFSTVSSLDDVLGPRIPAVYSTKDADLDGITTDEALALSSFVYQGFLSVDEEGTQAPAGGATVKGAEEPAVTGARRFAVDRPFAFFVRDRQSGLVLLAGRVVKPR